MKRILYILVIIFLGGEKITAQSMNWTLVNTGTTKNIRDISFINRDTGFIAGDGGLLKYTTNGGATWTDMAIPLTGQGVGNNNNIKVAQFALNSGYVNGILFFDKFTEVHRMYGWPDTWMEECGTLFSQYDSICSINNYHYNGYAAQYTAGSNCTNDGGMYGFFGGFCFTYDTLKNDTGFSGWTDVTSNVNDISVIVGGNGYYGVSPGYSFADSVMNSGSGYNYLSVDWSDTSTVYAINDSYTWNLEKSTDDGQTFVIDSSWLNTFYYPQIAEMDFTDNDWGVMAGISNLYYGIIVTKRGNSYDFFQTDSALTSAYVVDSTTAFAGGLNGKLYKYDQTGTMGVDDVIENIDFNIFPNPQNSSNDILNLFVSQEVKEIAIYDMMGKVILNEKPNKQGAIQLNTGIQNPGTYIIRIYTDKGVGTKKYIVN